MMLQLEPSVKAIWSINILIQWVTLSAIVLIADYLFISQLIENWPLGTGMLSLYLLFFAIALSLSIPPLKYKFWKFEIRLQELYLERGILNRITTIAPFTRIQHIDVQQSLIERMFRLSKLVIYTAGTRGADIVIPGLPLEYAETLRDQLKNYSPENAI